MNWKKSIDDDLQAVEEIIRRKAPPPPPNPAPSPKPATKSSSDDTYQTLLGGGCLVAILLIVMFGGWAAWNHFSSPVFTPATPSKVTKGRVVIPSQITDATLFYRKVGAEKWRFVDCTPNAQIALSPGRYQIRIEGRGGRRLLPLREIEVLAGQKVDLSAIR